MANRTVYDRALWWLDQGVSLVPVKPGTKFLQPGFGVSRRTIETGADAVRWFFKGKYNLGVLSGTGPGLVVIDFDSAEAFAPWLREHADFETLIETSSTPGHGHVFVYDKTATNQAGPGVEVRAQRRVTVVAPSFVAGGTYRTIHNAPIAHVPVASLSLLLSKGPAVTIPGSAAAIPCRTTSANATLVEKIKAAHPILLEARDALAHNGFYLKSSDGGKGRWFIGRCPWHPDERPSFWVDAERGLFGCYVSGCRAHRGGDVINLRALRYGWDVRYAVVDLARALL